MTQMPCPSCHAESSLEPFYAVERVPTNACILLEDARAAAKFPRGDITLAVCRGCGFICNTSFNLELLEYSDRYEESQSASPTFVRFHEQMVESLIDKHGLRGKLVLEIGCGKGDFLDLMVKKGDNIGVGYDPAYDSDRQDDERLLIHKKWFSEFTPRFTADLVACKMTLEHIPDVEEFMVKIRNWIGNTKPVVYFQVPNTSHSLNHLAFQDIQYEHCSYFVPSTLNDLFRRTGFYVTATEITYDGQYLTVEAVPGEAQAGRWDHVADVKEDCRIFAKSVTDLLGRWNRFIRDEHAAGRRLVLWGSGSKAVAMLSTLDLRREVPFVVDINPVKHDKYLPGTGQHIIAPESLVGLEPDTVVIMNSVYRGEITEMMAAMGIAPKVMTMEDML